MKNFFSSSLDWIQKLDMQKALFFLRLFVLTSLVVFTASQSLAQEVLNQESVDGTVAEINDYVSLIKQLSTEGDGALGYQAKALSRQLKTTQEDYRNLLWHFAADLLDPANEAIKQKQASFALPLLLEESAVLTKEIDSSQIGANELEQEIADGKRSMFSTNQAVAKDRIADLNGKLELVRKHQEILAIDLVKNGLILKGFGEEAKADLELGRTQLMKQADTLSGLIGLNDEKLLKIEKKLSAVRGESSTGQALNNDRALLNVETQAYASRLQLLVDAMDSLALNTTLYKKTLIQSKNSLSVDIFDKQVASHLFTEWWLNTKKWFSQQAPTLLGNTITFLGILFLSYLVATVARKVVRGLFARSNTDTFELAKNFVIVMTFRLVMLIGFLIALANLGVQIGPILAGLGIMGFIIGFALQETLSNFASGLMILIYQPFDVGDKIRVDGLEGKVQAMNLVSTTIFTSANHHLTVPNNKIWKDTIHNITSQDQVRMDLFFTAPFNADSGKVLSAIRAEVDANPIVLSDREKNIRIYELGEMEVRYIARFWIASEDIDEAKWVVSEGIKHRFDEAGISQDILEHVKALAG